MTCNHHQLIRSLIAEIRRLRGEVDELNCALDYMHNYNARRERYARAEMRALQNELEYERERNSQLFDALDKCRRVRW